MKERGRGGGEEREGREGGEGEGEGEEGEGRRGGGGEKGGGSHLFTPTYQLALPSTINKSR